MKASLALQTVFEQGQSVGVHQPWLRVVVTPTTWTTLAEGLGSGAWSLLGLWGEAATVHMALREPTSGVVGVASIQGADGKFPAVSRWHPPAQRLERALADLTGLQPVDWPDSRPWLDHGRWPCRHPLSMTPSAARTPWSYRFLPVEGESVHQIPVGPVHAGIIEPGHFRFTANGEAVVRLEARLGYVHKGIERLLTGAPIARAAQLLGRVSGDSTVAYAFAFARAVEAATATEVPRRAHWLRALMAELERIANHCGDIGAICNDAAFAVMLAYFGVLRERVLRASAACFGHRLLMDCIVPGGVTADLSADGVKNLHALLADLRRGLPPLIKLYDNTASLQDRTVGTGLVRPILIEQFACGGYVGRAGGRHFDARQALPYPPYDQLTFEVPVWTDSDVNARVWVRIHEVQQSLKIIEQLLTGLPSGAIYQPLSPLEASSEGVALVEGFRGDVLVWLRLAADGTVERCHPRDPSWFQWPLLEAAIEGNIVADFPLCNKSFNCSYSGHDL